MKTWCGVGWSWGSSEPISRSARISSLAWFDLIWTEAVLKIFPGINLFSRVLWHIVRSLGPCDTFDATRADALCWADYCGSQRPGSFSFFRVCHQEGRCTEEVPALYTCNDGPTTSWTRWMHFFWHIPAVRIVGGPELLARPSHPPPKVSPKFGLDNGKLQTNPGVSVNQRWVIARNQNYTLTPVALQSLTHSNFQGSQHISLSWREREKSSYKYATIAVPYVHCYKTHSRV